MKSRVSSFDCYAALIIIIDLSWKFLKSFRNWFKDVFIKLLSTRVRSIFNDEKEPLIASKNDQNFFSANSNRYLEKLQQNSHESFFHQTIEFARLSPTNKVFFDWKLSKTTEQSVIFTFTIMTYMETWDELEAKYSDMYHRNVVHLLPWAKMFSIDFWTSIINPERNREEVWHWPQDGDQWRGWDHHEDRGGTHQGSGGREWEQRLGVSWQSWRDDAETYCRSTGGWSPWSERGGRWSTSSWTSSWSGRLTCSSTL